MKDRKGTVTSVRMIVKATTDGDQRQDDRECAGDNGYCRDEGEYRSMGERRTAPSVRGKGVHHDLRCNNL